MTCEDICMMCFSSLWLGSDGVTGYFRTGRMRNIPINPNPCVRIFGNHQDISEPAIRSLALMKIFDFMSFSSQFFFFFFVAALMRLCKKPLLTINRILDLTYSLFATWSSDRDASAISTICLVSDFH